MKLKMACVIILSALSSCATFGPGRSGSVIVYGRPTCSLTTAFRGELEAHGIAYRFVNVDESDENNGEMWETVEKAHPGVRRFQFPVVHVGTAVLLSPSFEDFSEYYR